MALVLFNIGWMRSYEGQTPSDRISNGGKFIDDHGFGGEVENFKVVGEYVYGYVRPSPGSTINVRRLGASRDASYVDNVTIVFTARRPEGGGVVIGWYKDARVWRYEQRINERSYYARTSKDNSVLLEIDERVLYVPLARDPNEEWGVGHSNIRYVAQSDESKKYIRKLRAYLENPTEFNDFREQSGHRQPIDPAQRAKVEKAAINHVTNYYSEKGFVCESVERDNKGWDLEVNRGVVHLIVEVKGCSGDATRVELTPNEYRAMCAQRNKYRLAIVTTALQHPRLSIFSYNESDDTWRDRDGREAELIERTGVRIAIN